MDDPVNWRDISGLLPEEVYQTAVNMLMPLPLKAYLGVKKADLELGKAGVLIPAWAFDEAVSITTGKQSNAYDSIKKATEKVDEISDITTFGINRLGKKLKNIIEGDPRRPKTGFDNENK